MLVDHDATRRDCDRYDYEEYPVRGEHDQTDLEPIQAAIQQYFRDRGTDIRPLLDSRYRARRVVGMTGTYYVEQQIVPELIR